MTNLACIGEPISWLRLETFATGKTDPAIATHLAACPACTHCLDEIRTDLVALPPLAIPEVTRRRSPWPWLVPALGLAVAAAIALLVLAPWRGEQPQLPRDNAVAVKGVGDVIVDIVRERGGVVRADVRTFAPGDRWKVVVTCPPAASAAFDVSVTEAGSSTGDRPLAPAQLACGNRVVIPGAFAITGDRANRVCVAITAAEGTGRACLTLSPEPR
jgi:hypothetical protein